ncbi:MAG: DUF1559 domain-containing protein, partial [Planctomycetaceae bacterium]|nr:DUF1559 domain-containing protein [Planctomycetaceae bacterium]
DPASLKTMLDSTGSSSRMHPFQKTILNTLAGGGKDWNMVFRRVNETFDQEIAGFRYHSLASHNPLHHLTMRSRSEQFAYIFLDFFFPAGGAYRGAYQRLECADNLKRIQLAMFLYHAEQGTLPPAFSVDADGRPLHSWRTLLLPYLGDATLAELHSQIRLDEPWDSEHNRQFHERNIDLYRCPSAGGNAGDSHYAVITGDDLLFRRPEVNGHPGDDRGRTLESAGRYMLMVVERKEGICWMQPDSDMTQSVAEAGLVGKGITTVGSNHTGGCNIALRDGSVIFISDSLLPDAFIGLVRGTAKEKP